jgi:hypothetical protein
MEKLTFLTSKLHAEFGKHWFLFGRATRLQIFKIFVFIYQCFEVGFACYIGSDLTDAQ